MHSDPLLMATVVLLVVTLAAFVIYYRRIRKVKEEYDKARNVVEEIITSFDNQLERQERKLTGIAQTAQILSSETVKAAGKSEENHRRSTSLEKKVEVLMNAGKKLAPQIEELTGRVEKIDTAQEEISKKIEEIGKSKEEVETTVSKASIEAAIPIRKEKALAPLTTTELSVLEIIAGEGRMTAPEVREEVKLTREHTSRLMKKLYEDGYLERVTRKMPYTYSIKEEMLKILKRRTART